MTQSAVISPPLLRPSDLCFATKKLCTTTVAMTRTCNHLWSQSRIQISLEELESRFQHGRLPSAVASITSSRPAGGKQHRRAYQVLHPSFRSLFSAMDLTSLCSDTVHSGRVNSMLGGRVSQDPSRITPQFELIQSYEFGAIQYLMYRGCTA